MEVIDVKHVSKSFKDFSLQDISLQLPKGYIMGLIGKNGAGKTTLIKILMGLYLRDSGDITILGMDLKKDGSKIRDKIGVVFDNPLYYDFSLKSIKKILSPFYSNWDEEKFRKYLEKFDLKIHYKFKKLSRGMKLKFALAIALSHNAELLILDEPTSGLDPVFRIKLLSILQEVIESEGCTILFSSHITSDIEKIADFIAYIKDGKMVFIEDKNDVMSNYMLIKGNDTEIPESVAEIMIAGQIMPYCYEALIPAHNEIDRIWQLDEKPTLEQIMFYHELRG